MIIESLHIDCFGCLSDFSCTFDDRLTVIEGENESGKSTLAAFIRYMLYGFTGRASSTELTEKKKRIHWKNGRAAGSMTVRVGENRYRIERSTVLVSGARGKDTYRESGSIIDLGTRIPLPGTESAGERFLGVPETVFVNTAFVGQVSSRVGSGELNEAIENLLFSGDENLNVQRALDKLEGVRRSLLHKNGKGGELFELEKEEEALATALRAASEDNRQLLEEEMRLSSATARLAEAKKKADAAARRLTEEESALLLASYARLHEAEEACKTANEALRNMDGLPAYRLTESDLSDLAHARGVAETTERQYREAEARAATYIHTGVDDDTAELTEKAEAAGGAEALRAEARALQGKRTLGLVLGGVALLLALGIFGLGIGVPALFGELLVLPFLLSIVCFGAGVAFLFMGVGALRALSALYRAYCSAGANEFWQRMGEIERAKKQTETFRHAAKEAADAARQAQLAFERAEGELDTVLHRFNTRLPNEDRDAFLDTLVAQVKDVMEKKKGHEATLLQAGSTVAALEKQLEGTSEVAARAALPKDREIDPEKTDLSRRRQERDMSAAQVRVLTEEVHTLDMSVGTLRARIADPAALQAELDALRAHKNEVQERYDACLLAYEAIAGAGERLRAEVSPRLSAFACDMMNTLTGGRYADIGVDRDLGLSFGAGDGTYTVDYMSTGAQDMTYLSLRMALIDLLYKEKPPVCFDESFAFQDDGRTEAVLTTLAERAKEGGQCLIFTCHTREREVAARILPSAPVIRMQRNA